MVQHVTVVGAGLAGLAATRRLLAAGLAVDVVDKGRGVGGRLATRRMDGARLDHGVQFLPSGDGPEASVFAALLDEAEAAGVVDRRAAGAVCPGGMTGLAKWLADQARAAGASVTTDRRISSVSVGDGRWRLVDTDGVSADTDAIVLTPPVPQILELLDAGDVVLDADLAGPLAQVTYRPTVGLLLVLDGPPALSTTGFVEPDDGPLAMVVDNGWKGVSERPALTVHADASTSSRRWDDDPDSVTADLLAAAAPWIGTAGVVAAQLKKWRYAVVDHSEFDTPVAAATDPGPLVLAGDAFGRPDAAGAWASGLAAAEPVIDAKDGV
ncbi:MAG: NAD(P)-binding protein [Actinomycetota bacterium]